MTLTQCSRRCCRLPSRRRSHHHRDPSSPRHLPRRNPRARTRACPPACDNTPSQPHAVGGEASQNWSPGSPVGEYPPRKKTPKSTHARRRPGEDAPSGKHELCDRKFTFSRQRPRGSTHASPSYPLQSPSVPLRPSENPPQTPSKDPQKPSSEGPWGQSQRRTAEVSDTALRWGGERVLRDTLAAPRCRGRGEMLVSGPGWVCTKLGP